MEYALWLPTTGRLLLFIGFVLVALFLLFVYILSPIFYLIKLKQGIGPKDAAQIIGRHFPSVGDKLYNLLDLADQPEKSELLLASIEQRSKSLGSVPFTQAITYRTALSHAKYLTIPLLIFLAVYISGQWQGFFSSYDRVVHYDLAYEPPAPFQFNIMTPVLDAIASEPFEIQVSIAGNVRPDNVYLEINGKELLLSEQKGVYSYTLTPPLSSTTFRFRGNEVRSKEYYLNAINAPAILDFSMELAYPNYLKKPTETIKSTGNALIPEGTAVTWRIKGQDTEKIALTTKDTSLIFSPNGNNGFALTQDIMSSMDYSISTSNSQVPNYETLNYTFTVVKDAYPAVKVQQVMDSLNPNVSYFSGEASDDYGLRTIDLVYFEEGKESDNSKVRISEPGTTLAQFYYTYPSGLELVPGKSYAFYFLITDNDVLHGGKTTKSQVFRQVLLDNNQLKNRELDSQQSLIKNLDDSLEKAKDQKEALEELNQRQKEKKSLNFNDQNQIKDFLKKQEQQEALMEKFSKELKQNLEKDNTNDEINQLLQERLERRELEAKKNQKLLEELEKIADKINKEELTKRLEELGKQQQNSERSLAQLLELTKRYYVTEKAAQLARDLKELGKKQEKLGKLPKGKLATEQEQQQLNEAYEELSKSLDELQKDNQSLKKPISLKIDSDKKESAKTDQQEALNQLKKSKASEGTQRSEKEAGDAKQKQNNAAQKMKEMSEQLSSSSSGASGGETMAEDAEMLRQILDNLIIFSFKQEQLFNRLNEREEQDVSQYSRTVRNQKELRDLFTHVDDSLFALSLRQAELSEFVNEQITEVYYNIDKSLESMADGQMYQGISYQKYVLNATNSLADFLANVMDNMQESMQMGQGSGKSQGGFQLPDIIKGQSQLSEKMGQGKQGEQGQGQEGKQGEGQEGQKGTSGEQGQQGEEGQEGDQGDNGNQDGGRKGQNDNGTQGSNGQGTQKEEDLREIYEIYQEQQRIRQALEEQLLDMMNTEDRELGAKILKQMEDFQNDLLENGITQRTLNKANTIQYELLKLENAALKQGKKEERESNTNQQDFSNPITTKPSLLENYRNEVEILNRQALPLRQNFQNKVKEYFKSNDPF